jgi:hypothetical protein
MPDLEQWRSDISRWGALRFAHIRVMSFLRHWLTVCRIHVRPLNASARVPTLPPGYTVRIVTVEDLLEAARDPIMDLRPASIHAALERGDFCASAFDGDRMIAYVWRSFTTAPHVDGLWVTFERPYRYGYKAFTRAEYRGMHLQDALSYLTEPPCIERGYPMAIAFVETHNYSSITQDVRRGNRVVGWAGYLKLFDRVYPFHTPGARKHTFRFVRSRSDGRVAEHRKTT